MDEVFEQTAESKKSRKPLLIGLGIVMICTLLIAAFLLLLVFQTKTAIESGIEAYEAGNYELAVEEFSRALQINPDSAGVYERRAWAYIHLENYEAAISDFSHAIELVPENAYYNYGNRANAYYLLGRYEEALADYRMAEELDAIFPDDQRQIYEELRATVAPES